MWSLYLNEVFVCVFFNWLKKKKALAAIEGFALCPVEPCLSHAVLFQKVCITQELEFR